MLIFWWGKSKKLLNQLEVLVSDKEYEISYLKVTNWYIDLVEVDRFVKPGWLSLTKPHRQQDLLRKSNEKKKWY